MTPSLTEAQQRATTQRGNVLVVAGAGTGKTRTLVHRCVRFLLQEQCGLDEILMVTFTDAAAAEMRKRIREELRILQQTESGSPRADYIRKQLLLLDAAHIGTLHSFCLKVVRRHTHQLGIDPAVSVLDEQQTAPLRSQVLDELFEHHYEGENEASEGVRLLVQQLGGGNDMPVRSLVLRVHHYCQSLDSPDKWLAEQELLYSNAQPASWRKAFEVAFEEWRAEWLPVLRNFAHVPAVQLCTSALGEGARPFAEVVQIVRRLSEIECDDRNWPSGSKEKTLESFRKDVNYLASTLCHPSGEDILSEEWNVARPQVLTMLRLVREFEQRYSAAKREIGGVEFSDLEQMALRLLRTDTGQRTPLADQWRRRFRFIFVDECQDINRAQDAIIRAVSRDGDDANRFLVGDVKQSIYRFRRADPSIFTEYERAWREGGEGERIPLSDNFRSRESILRFVNALFSGLMRPAVGGIAYEADAHLQFAKPDERQHLASVNEAKKSPRVELHVIDNQNTVDEADSDTENPETPNGESAELTSIEREARLAAVLLRRLRAEKHEIWDEDKNRMRPVEWSDMAILLRSVRGRVEAYAKEFSKAGIPLIAARSGFFAAIEVADLINLLREKGIGPRDRNSKTTLLNQDQALAPALA